MFMFILYRAAGRGRDPRQTGWQKSTSLACSIGTTPHLVGVAHLRILISQSIAEIQPLFDFEKYFFGYPFHVVHRCLDLIMRSKKWQKQFFSQSFHYLATCGRCGYGRMAVGWQMWRSGEDRLTNLKEKLSMVTIWYGSVEIRLFEGYSHPTRARRVD